MGPGPGALLGGEAGQVPLPVPRHVAPNWGLLVIPFAYSLSLSVPPVPGFDFGEGAGALALVPSFQQFGFGTERAKRFF